MKDKLDEIRKLLADVDLTEDKMQLIHEIIDDVEEEINIHSHTKTLVEFSKEVTKLNKLEDIISFTVTKMNEFLNIEHSLIFFSVYNQEDETLEVKTLVGKESIKKTLLKIFTDGLLPDRIPVPSSQKTALLSHQLFKLPSLRTIMMDNISQDTAIDLEEELGTSHYYGYGFSDGVQPLATFGILSNVEIKPPVFELFELILNLLNTIIVQKAESQKTLTLYNHMTNILDISNYAFGIFNKNGTLLKGNKSFKKLFFNIPESAMNITHRVLYNEIGLSSSDIENLKKGYAMNIDPINFSNLFEENISSFNSGNITPVINANKEVEYYILFMISQAEDNRLLRSMQIQEEKYQRIFQHIQDVYFEINIEGKILEISPSIERYFGQPREYFLGRNIIEFYANSEDRSDYIKELSKNGAVVNYRIDLQKHNGSIVHGMVTSTIVDKGTSNERVIGSLTDFSNQYKYLNQISESENKLRSLFDHSPLGIMIINTKGDILDINKQLLSILGSPSKQETSKFNMFELKNIQESGLTETIKECINKGTDTITEIKYKSFWGKELYAKIIINSILDESGKTSMIVLMAEDISKIKEIDEQLQESQERLKDIYEKTNDLIYTMDFEGNFTSVNPIGEKWLGYKYNNLESKNMSEFITHDSAKRAIENIRKKLKGDSTQTSYEIEVFTQSGMKMTLEVNSFLRYKNEQPIEVFGIARDITERKKHEEFIQSSLMEKKSLNKEMHHRVKNNLQMIISLMKMHNKKTDDIATKHILNDISQKILAISAVHEDFYFSHNFKEIPFRKYLETILYNAIETIENGNHIQTKLDIGNINTDIDTAIPVGLIVSELIHNSIHHAFGENTQGGEIKISMSSIGEDIRIVYYDNGKGFDVNILNNDDLSSGIQLIKMLAENQLDGKFNISSGEKGTEVTIEFKVRNF